MALWLNPHLRNMVVFTLICAVIYHVPLILQAAGMSTNGVLSNFHDLYGIDFLGLVFFVPVLYAAYKIDIVPAVLTAFIVFLILLPQAIADGTYPNAMFKPAAFIIILSAVGAVVAMLQKSEMQQRQRMREMKCIYDIGRATEDASSVEDFLWKVVSIIPHAMPDPNSVYVSVKYLDSIFRYSRPVHFPRKVTEDLVINGAIVGHITIRSSSDNPYIKKKNHLTRTLAERISGAVREVELVLSLQTYYAQLEDEVAARTHALEALQEKLIRSERLSAVGEMASGVGHELRNPLNVMRNCLYLLKMSLDGNATQDVNETIQTLDKNIDASNKIVTDLLDYTRIKKSVLQNADLNDIVKEAMKGIEIPQGTTVRAEYADSPVSAYVDGGQISRAIFNIVTNAVQAIKSGNGRLAVTTGSGNGQSWVRVEDNGCGIPEESLPKIFEPLFTTKPKGIGLGLAITRQLIEQNNGTIQVESRAGEGTTVIIRLPDGVKERSR